MVFCWGFSEATATPPIDVSPTAGSELSVENECKGHGNLYISTSERPLLSQEHIDTFSALNRPVAMAEAKRNPPFRAEHLGSLLRPKELLQKRALFEKNELGRAELTEIENESVNKIVKVQLDAGFRAISDGEYRYVAAPKDFSLHWFVH